MKLAAKFNIYIVMWKFLIILKISKYILKFMLFPFFETKDKNNWVDFRLKIKRRFHNQNRLNPKFLQSVVNKTYPLSKSKTD
jgi:hypothetical protein